MFLMPGLVITCHVTGVLDTVLNRHAKQEMVRYLKNMQNKDGGYGLHIEGHSTMFGTVLRCAGVDDVALGACRLFLCHVCDPVWYLDFCM